MKVFEFDGECPFVQTKRGKEISLGYGPIVSSRERRGKYYPSGEYIQDEEVMLTKKELTEKVITKKEIIIQISYPLHTPASFLARSEDGFTLKQLIDIVSNAYCLIYAKEDETSEVEAMSVSEATGGCSCLINRCETDGKYGIWGHDMGDLMMHTLNPVGTTSKMGMLVCKGVCTEQNKIPVYDVDCDS